MKPSDVRRNYAKGRRIDGWFSLEAAMLFGLLDEVQRRAGVEGHLFEIGVHHGKSAVLLCALARPDEQVGVCDIFDGQRDNRSRSGSGDQQLFERNLRAAHPGFDRIELFKKRSAELDAAEISKPVRLFHVDGGHLAEEANGDIQLAASALHERGCVIVDDPFRPEWPGVTEGVLRHLEQDRDLTPVAMGFNKLVLVRAGTRSLYDDAMSSDEVWSYVRRRVYAQKTLPVIGQDVTIFYVPTRRKIAAVEPAVAQARWLVTTVKAGARRLTRGARA